MKKIKPRYPRRGKLLSTPFVPLSDQEFRELATAGLAIACRQGGALFVSKWRDRPGLETEGFLSSLRAQGSTMTVRRYNGDVNIRVVRSPPEVTGGAPSSVGSRRGSA